MARKNTKALFLETTSRLFRSRGFSGTGLKQIVSEAGAPWGSLYHFFPGGKDDLAIQTVIHTGEADNELFRQGFKQARNLPEAVRNIFKFEIKHQLATNYLEGCVVASVASDTVAVSEPVRKACSKIFSDWEETIAGALEQHAVPSTEAHKLASFILSALEGANLLSRTKRSIEPLKDAMMHVDIVVNHALEKAKTS